VLIRFLAVSGSEVGVEAPGRDTGILIANPKPTPNIAVAPSTAAAPKRVTGAVVTTAATIAAAAKPTPTATAVSTTVDTTNS